MKRPTFLPALSIRARLLVFLTLAVALTALAISAVTMVVGSRDARDRVIGQLKSVTTLKEQEISTWINGLGLNLDIVLSQAGIPEDLAVLSVPGSGQELRREAYSRVQERFIWAATRMGLFEELFFLDGSGAVSISTDSGHEGQRLGLNDFFVQGLKGSFIQQPSYSLSLGQMTVVASAPVLVQGETVGVIAGRADLGGLNQIMVGRAGLGETGETYLVGTNYRLLTELRQPGHPIPDTYIRTEGTDRAVGLNQEGSDTYEGYSGVPVIGVYEWIPRLQVGLIAEQEEAEALRPTRISLMIMGGVAILAAVLAIVSGIGLTHRIVRPLAQLGATAGRIAGGELDLVADLVQEDEIGTLARAFNSMTTRLRDLVRGLERRTDYLRAINQAGRQISSILDLDELLPYVARSLLRTFDYRSVQILLLTGDGHGTLLRCEDEAACGEPAALNMEDPACPAVLSVVAKTAEPFFVSAETPGALETTDCTAAASPDPQAPMASVETHAYQEIAVPIRAKETLLGVLDIAARDRHPLDEQDLFAAQTLADQLAVAIENSRLYEHAHELAAAQERQRLARDLHDAVSQTLFSVSLIAEVLPRIYERDPTQGQRRLEELRQLTRGALAEMRTLLLELRPAALTEASLPDLLRQLAESITGRALIPVEVLTDEACGELPADVRVAFYRIAQEALNNVAKHSKADKARIVLECCKSSVALTIEDDGVGFDNVDAGAGQLGLDIMRERAVSVGAGLEIVSTPGSGTRIVAGWSSSE